VFITKLIFHTLLERFMFDGWLLMNQSQSDIDIFLMFIISRIDSWTSTTTDYLLSRDISDAVYIV
jgi:hypothetical protein